MIVKILLVTALVGCAYDTRFEDCAVRCSDAIGCPDDLTCGPEGLCRASGMTETCSSVLGINASCLGLAATCGPNGDEDCCSTAEPISGGAFYRSYDVASDGMYPSMSYPATVSPFVLDRFEVTVGRFRKFVETGRGTRANPPPIGAGERRLNGMDAQGGWDESWNTSLLANTADLVEAMKCNAYWSWTDAPGMNEVLPIECVTWYEAFAFCVWDGGFLPTEAEWNFAAAGGIEQRAYPWSSPSGSTTIDCSYANYNNGSAYCVNPASGAVSYVGSVSPKGDGRWGHADLIGNVWEWMLDWHQPYMNPCADCASLTDASNRVVRGSNFFYAGVIRTARRFDAAPSARVEEVGVGIRCARTP